MAHNIATHPFDGIYDAYLAKVTRKQRTEEELREVLRWFTGHSDESLDAARESGVGMREFFERAPALNEAREQITGSICGVRVQEIADPFMRTVRQLDKVVDELAKGRPLGKILRE